MEIYHKLRNNMISIWCDFIERSFLQNEFKTLVREGKIQGATSNPSQYLRLYHLIRMDRFQCLLSHFGDSLRKVA